MNEIELKPCPFCGSDDVVFGAALEDEYYVECWDCSAKVESCNGLEDALAGWNARASGDVCEEPRDEVDVSNVRRRKSRRGSNVVGR